MKNKTAREAAVISLFLATLLIGLLLVNIIVLAGGKNLFLLKKVSTAMEQEAERALSYYDSILYDQYGLWAMPSALADALPTMPDVKKHIKDTEGAQSIKYELSENLWEPFAMKVQIDAFMRARYPLAVADQMAHLLGQYKTGLMSQELTQMKETLAQKKQSVAVNDFSTYLENVKDYEQNSDESENSEMSELTLEVMSALKKEMQKGLASSVDLETEQNRTKVDTEGIFTMLQDAQELVSFETNASYEKLALNEYLVRMFPAQVHKAELSDSYPIKKSLRSDTLLINSENEMLRLESLYTGKPFKDAEKTVRDYVWLLRFLCRMTSILSNKEKMGLYRNTANIIALAVAVASVGKIQLPPEALTYSIVTFISMKEASEDTEKLINAESVLFLPYTKNMQIETYYHDYLRLMLLSVPEEKLLERLCAALKEFFGEEYYTSVRIEISWQSPYLDAKQEQFTTRRTYAVYSDK